MLHIGFVFLFKSDAEALSGPISVHILVKSYTIKIYFLQIQGLARLYAA